MYYRIYYSLYHTHIQDTVQFSLFCTFLLLTHSCSAKDIKIYIEATAWLFSLFEFHQKESADFLFLWKFGLMTVITSTYAMERPQFYCVTYTHASRVGRGIIYRKNNSSAFQSFWIAYTYRAYKIFLFQRE